MLHIGKIYSSSKEALDKAKKEGIPENYNGNNFFQQTTTEKLYSNQRGIFKGAQN